MSMSTVFNPLSFPTQTEQTRPRLWVFYISSKGNPGLRQWTPGDGSAGEFWAERDESSTGNILEGSSLAAVGYRQWIRAYGITKYASTKTVKGKETTEDEYFVSLVSPVPQSLGFKTDYGRLAGTTDGNMRGEGDGWLYFLLNDPPEIHELKIGGTSTTAVDEDTKLLGRTDGLTYLSACYEAKTKSRFVVFQTHKKRIRVYNVGDRQDHTIEDTVNAKSATPLAAASYTGTGDKSVIVVYYVRKDDPALMRTYSVDGGSNWTTGSVKGAPTPSDTTTLSVSVDTFNKQAVVTYSTDSSVSTGIKFHPDPFI